MINSRILAGTMLGFVLVAAVLFGESNNNVPASANLATSQPVAKNAPKRFVFIASSGGSMLAHFGQVKAAIYDRLSKATSDQLVGVYFASKDAVHSFCDGKLIPATPAVKTKIQKAMQDEISSGGSDVMVAVAQAEKLKPDVVWLYSNGFGPDPKVFVDAVRKLSKQSHIPINTSLAYVETNAEYATYAQVLFQIAQESGGTCFDKTDQPVKTAPGKPIDP